MTTAVVMTSRPACFPRVHRGQNHRGTGATEQVKKASKKHKTISKAQSEGPEGVPREPRERQDRQEFQGRWKTASRSLRKVRGRSPREPHHCQLAFSFTKRQISKATAEPKTPHVRKKPHHKWGFYPDQTPDSAKSQNLASQTCILSGQNVNNK